MPYSTKFSLIAIIDGQDADYYELSATPSVLHVDKDLNIVSGVEINLWHIVGDKRTEASIDGYSLMLTDTEQAVFSMSVEQFPFVINKENLGKDNYQNLQNALASGSKSLTMEGWYGASNLVIPVVMDGGDGDPGKDAVTIEANPTAVVWNQNDNLSWPQMSVIAGVRQGDTLDNTGWKFAVSFEHVRAISADSSVLLGSPLKDADGNYYTQGSVTFTATRDNTTLTRTVPVIMNAQGTWRQSVKNDTMTAVSEKKVSYYDGDGNIQTGTFESAIEQSSKSISTKVKENGDTMAAVGITKDGITLNARTTKVQNADGTKDIAVFNDDGTVNINQIIARGQNGKSKSMIKFGIFDDEPVLLFYNSLGKCTLALGSGGRVEGRCMITKADQFNDTTATNNAVGKSITIGYHFHYILKNIGPVTDTFGDGITLEVTCNNDTSTKRALTPSLGFDAISEGLKQKTATVDVDDTVTLDFRGSYSFNTNGANYSTVPVTWKLVCDDTSKVGVHPNSDGQAEITVK